MLLPALLAGGSFLLLPTRATTLELADCPHFVGIIDDGTRLGDRILDSWSLITLFNFKNSSSKCDIYWQPNHSYANMITPIGRCNIHNLHRKFERDNGFDAAEYGYDVMKKICIVDFHDLITVGAGNADPLTLYNNANVRQFLPHNIREEMVVDQFKSVARSTVPNSQFTRQIVQQSNDAFGSPIVGVHIRLTDKIRTDPMTFTDKQYFTSLVESNLILDRIVDFAETTLIKVHKFKMFFLAVDHENHFNTFARRLEDVGGIVVNRNRSNTNVFYDFFSLSKCRIVLQGIRYSSFSVAAAAIGDAILVNFSPIFNNNLQRWLSIVRSIIIEADLLEEKSRSNQHCYPLAHFVNTTDARNIKEAFSKNLYRELTRVLNKDEKAMMISMKPWEAGHSRFDAVGPLVPRCRTKLEKFGNGDEEKRACDLIGFAGENNNCVVISIGSKNIWTFEEGVVRQTKCYVHVFDCTLESSGGIHVPDALKHRVTGHNICIGSQDEVVGNRQFLSYGSLLKHAKVLGTPTFLKMDIEGYEWEVIPNIIENFYPQLPLQVAFELHYGQDPALPLPWGHSWKTAGEIITFIDYLYRVGGYYIIDRHDNAACGYATELLMARVCM